MAALRETGSPTQRSVAEYLALRTILTTYRNPKNLTRHGITSFGLLDQS
jgi:hypothetical protein